MSEPGFESLLYTDCRQGQGLRGGAGFQFQAVSPGASTEMMTLVQQSALYEAPVAWMRDKRPVPEYPPSLAHIYDGVYATARGVYLGAEVDGVREGNQFTHAISTVDPQLYGPTRPAQLWNSPWWSERPAASTQCDPVPADPEPGLCGVEAVRDWLLGRHDGAKWLLALNSALDRVWDGNAERVVLVGSDPDEIVRWIAAATLLLPQERALRVGFRVFATDPRYSKHEVLALHPDWAGQLADPTRNNGFVVFNLESGRHSPVEPTESASHWVPRFLRDDPFDVIDAVELAHQFARNADRDRPTLGDRLASCVLTLGDPVTDRSNASELGSWLAAAPPASTTEALEPITRAIMDGAPDRTLLRELVTHVHTGSAALAQQLRYVLLRAEIDEVVRNGSDAGNTALPERPWDGQELERALSLVEGAATVIPPERMDLLLRLATGFGITPRLDRFGDAAAGFIRWWADTPDAALEPARWSCSTRIIDLLRDELEFRLRGPRPETTRAAVREHWWRLLLPTLNDPFMLLDGLVASAAVAQGGQFRADAIAKLYGLLRESTGPGNADAVWSVLFQQSDPTVTEMTEFVMALPSAMIPDSVAQKVCAVLANSTPTAQHLDLIQRMQGHVQAESLLALREQDEVLQYWLSSFRRSKGARSPAGLDTVSKPVLDARALDVVDALLDVELPMAMKVVARNGEALQEMLVRELAAVCDGDSDSGRGDKAVALAFLIGWSGTTSEQIRAECDEALERWTGEHKQSDHRRIGRVLRTVGPDRQSAWQEKLHTLGKSRTRKSATLRGVFGQRRKRGE